MYTITHSHADNYKDVTHKLAKEDLKELIIRFMQQNGGGTIVLLWPLPATTTDAAVLRDINEKMHVVRVHVRRLRIKINAIYVQNALFSVQIEPIIAAELAEGKSARPRTVRVCTRAIDRRRQDAIVNREHRTCRTGALSFPARHCRY